VLEAVVVSSEDDFFELVNKLYKHIASNATQITKTICVGVNLSIIAKNQSSSIM